MFRPSTVHHRRTVGSHPYSVSMASAPSILGLRYTHSRHLVEGEMHVRAGTLSHRSGRAIVAAPEARVMRIPLSLSVYEHAAALIGRTPWDVSRSGELLWQAHREAYRLYHHFPVTIGIDIYNVEAEAYGCTVSRPAGHGIPAITSPLLARLEDGQRLQPPSTDSGRFPLLIEAGRRVKAEFPEADVRIPISGPFSVAQSLLGAEVLLTEVATRPDEVRRFLLHLVEAQVRFTQAVATAGLGVAFFESAAAPPLLSPRQFREVELPALKEAIGRVSTVVGRRVPCIIGGDTASIVPEIMETGTDFVICPAETDRSAFLRQMNAYPGVKVRVNLEPSVYSQGTPADITAAVDAVVVLAAGRPNVLLGTGAIPYETPPANLLFLIDYTG
ncbi:MAG: uroporphyrinogen decarboxylase family protein [Anaerolineae bacterium]